MSQIKNILVTGGTGKTGRAVIKTLLKKGIKPRVAARNIVTDSTTDFVRFDWLDHTTHEKALENIDAVYIVAPTLVLDPVPSVEAFIRKAMSLGVKRFVLLSSSAIPMGGPAMGQIHQFLAENAEQWTVLQPSWFMQNFTEGHHGDSIKNDNAIYSATQTAGVGFIDAEDIGKTAAEYLLAAKALNGSAVLTGSTSPNYQEVAKIISSVVGRKIRHVTLTEAELAERFEKVVEMPQDYAQFLAGLDAFLAGGSEDRVTDVVDEMTGHSAKSFKEFANENQNVWQQ